MGYDPYLAATRTRRLFSHEYGMIFYLGERVMRQHSPDMPIRIPAWPPIWMRQVSNMPLVDVPALIDGIPFEGLVHEGDYVAFVDRYLMREQKGVRGLTFYEICSTRGRPHIYPGPTLAILETTWLFGSSSKPSGEGYRGFR